MYAKNKMEAKLWHLPATHQTVRSIILLAKANSLHESEVPTNWVGPVMKKSSHNTVKVKVVSEMPGKGLRPLNQSVQNFTFCG